MMIQVANFEYILTQYYFRVTVIHVKMVVPVLMLETCFCAYVEMVLLAQLVRSVIYRISYLFIPEQSYRFIPPPPPLAFCIFP